MTCEVASAMKRCQILTTWRISYQQSLHSQLMSPCYRFLRRCGGIIEPMYQFTLDGELALWRQKWLSQLSDRPDAVIPQTAAEGSAACDQQAFPLIHTF